ncbi:41104_t:CDS:2, partial [Gigaspora margarita]
PGELTSSHSTQNSNSTTKKEKKRRRAKESHLQITFEDPDIANGSYNQHTKSYHNYYNSDFDGEEVVDVNIEDDKGYDPEAPKIPFLCKDSITIFDGNNHNVSSMPTKKKKKNNKFALSINSIWNTNNNEERQLIREFWLQLDEEEQWSLVKNNKNIYAHILTTIEEELEALYDAYYKELELYANQ